MVEINDMQLGDLESVLELAAQLGYPGELSNFQRRFMMMSQSRDHVLLVARMSGASEGVSAVVGWIHVGKEMSSLLGNDNADVGALVVDSKVRGRGIGAKLLEAGEKWAQSKNWSLVRVRSNVKRTDAHRFYERNGYTLKKSWNLYTKTLTNEERAIHQRKS